MWDLLVIVLIAGAVFTVSLLICLFFRFLFVSSVLTKLKSQSSGAAAEGRFHAPGSRKRKRRPGWASEAAGDPGFGEAEGE